MNIEGRSILQLLIHFVLLLIYLTIMIFPSASSLIFTPHLKRKCGNGCIYHANQINHSLLIVVNQLAVIKNFLLNNPGQK